MVDFKSLKFGYASAKEESQSDPNLLLEGYYDSFGMVDDLLRKNKFLVLGYKGTGKSAIAEHLRLRSQIAVNKLVVTPVYLEDFPYSSFKKIISGEDTLESRLPTAWSWILSLLALTAFLQDKDAVSSSSQNSIPEIIEFLRQANILPINSATLKSVVLSCSKNSFKNQVKNLLDPEESVELLMPLLVEKVKSAVTDFRSPNQHLIIFDGLDDILTKKDFQFTALAALIFETERMNSLFRQFDLSMKILILCRTDLFEKLPGPNKNKVRQDSAIVLDWFSDPRNPAGSHLFNLVNFRARLSTPSVSNIFEEFFPSKMESGQDTFSFLLDMTRHTPRDLLQLLLKIQFFTKSSKPTREQIMSGVRDYSYNFFVPEIKDELAGYFHHDQIEELINIFGSMHKRDFPPSEIHSYASANFSPENMQEALKALFECSAIGNVYKMADGNTRFSFKYRGRNSTYNAREKIILHRGMWKAMNLV